MKEHAQLVIQSSRQDDDTAAILLFESSKKEEAGSASKAYRGGNKKPARSLTGPATSHVVFRVVVQPPTICGFRFPLAVPQVVRALPGSQGEVHRGGHPLLRELASYGNL